MKLSASWTDFLGVPNAVDVVEGDCLRAAMRFGES